MHSVLPPSGAEAWVTCGAWVDMTRRYPQAPTPESMEGDAAHWCFAEMLHGRGVVIGMQAPNGIIVSDEMIEGAELYTATVRKRVPSNASIYVEQRVAIPNIHKECFGTPDTFAFFDYDGLTLEHFDYKFGHRFVDEFENWQSISYVSGIIEFIAKLTGRPYGEIDQEIKVNSTIIQPRCFYKGSSVRTWSFTGSDIRAYVNKLSTAAENILGPFAKPQAVTNPACIDCPGRFSCQALQRAAYNDAEFATASTPVELTPEAASLELRMLERARDRIQSRVEGLGEYVASLIRSGKPVPFHHAEQGYGRESWNVPAEDVIALGIVLGVKLEKKAVITPVKARELGIDEAVIKAYSQKPLGKIKLVSNNQSDARRVFGN